jgi:hypothetical protein
MRTLSPMPAVFRRARREPQPTGGAQIQTILLEINLHRLG